jgi:hypothetical protein
MTTLTPTTVFSSLDDMMDVDGHRANKVLPPYFTLSHCLAERGLPSRFDPMSVDHFMFFEVDNEDDQQHHNVEGFMRSRHQHIPVETVTAIQYGKVDQFLMLGSNRNYLRSQRNDQGESLLHVASWWGSSKIVERLLEKDIQLSPFVLDQRGRSPLHTACLAVVNNQTLDSTRADYIGTIRLLLRHAPALTLYTDQQGRTPLEYLNSNTTRALEQQVNDLLVQQNVIERTVEHISSQSVKQMSAQRMSAVDHVDRYVNLSGLDAAIMESGFSI